MKLVNRKSKIFDAYGVFRRVIISVLSIWILLGMSVAVQAQEASFTWSSSGHLHPGAYGCQMEIGNRYDLDAYETIQIEAVGFFAYGSQGQPGRARVFVYALDSLDLEQSSQLIAQSTWVEITGASAATYYEVSLNTPPISSPHILVSIHQDEKVEVLTEITGDNRVRAYANRCHDRGDWGEYDEIPNRLFAISVIGREVVSKQLNLGVGEGEATAATDTPTPAVVATATAVPSKVLAVVRTSTPTPTATATVNPTKTPEALVIVLPSVTATLVPTLAIEQTATATPGITQTASATQIPTLAASDTPTPTVSPVPTATATALPSQTAMPTNTATYLATATPNPTLTSTPTPSPTASATSTLAPTDTVTPTEYIPTPEAESTSEA